MERPYYILKERLHTKNGPSQVYFFHKMGASTVILQNFYNAYIRAKIDYGAEVYGASSASRLKVLDSIQNSCLRLVLGARKTSPIYSVEVEAAVPSLEMHRNYLNLKLLIKLKSRPCNDGTAVKMNLDGNSMEFPIQLFLLESSEIYELSANRTSKKNAFRYFQSSSLGRYQ